MKRNLISSVVLVALALSAGAAMAAEEGPIRRARRVELSATRVGVSTTVEPRTTGIRERTATPGLQRVIGVDPLKPVESLAVPPSVGTTVIQRGLGLNHVSATAEVDSSRDLSRRAGFVLQASKLSDLGEMAGLDAVRTNSGRRANFRFIKVTPDAELTRR